MTITCLGSKESPMSSTIGHTVVMVGIVAPGRGRDMARATAENVIVEKATVVAKVVAAAKVAVVEKATAEMIEVVATVGATVTVDFQRWTPGLRRKGLTLA